MKKTNSFFNSKMFVHFKKEMDNLDKKNSNYEKMNVSFYDPTRRISAEHVNHPSPFPQKSMRLPLPSFLSILTNILDYSCGFCNLVFPSSHLLCLHKEDTKHLSDDGFEEVTESEARESEH